MGCRGYWAAGASLALLCERVGGQHSRARLPHALLHPTEAGDRVSTGPGKAGGKVTGCGETTWMSTVGGRVRRMQRCQPLRVGITGVRRCRGEDVNVPRDLNWLL